MGTGNYHVKFDRVALIILSKFIELGHNVTFVLERKLILRLLCIELHGVAENLLLGIICKNVLNNVIALNVRDDDFINDGIVKILTAKIVVSLGISNLHDTIFNFKDCRIKGTTTKVKYNPVAVFLVSAQAICHRCGNRFLEQLTVFDAG